MNASTTLVMETQHVTTQLDLSCVCVIEDLLVMDSIVQVRTSNRETYRHSMFIQDSYFERRFL